MIKFDSIVAGGGMAYGVPSYVVSPTALRYHARCCILLALECFLPQATRGFAADSSTKQRQHNATAQWTMVYRTRQSKDARHKAMACGAVGTNAKEVRTLVWAMYVRDSFHPSLATTGLCGSNRGHLHGPTKKNEIFQGSRPSAAEEVCKRRSASCS